VGALVYLYSPSSQLRSDFIASSEVVVVVEPQISISQEVSEDATTARRIRLTNMLLKHQSQLRDLENVEGQNDGVIEEISQLRIKIENLESMIKKLSE
jgi:hypothetical protein